MTEHLIEWVDINRIKDDTELLRRTVFVAGLALSASELNMSIATKEVQRMNEAYEQLFGTVINIETDEAITLWENGGVESLSSSRGERGKFSGFDLFDRVKLARDRGYFLNHVDRRLDLCLILLPPDVAIPESSYYTDVETKTLIPLRQIKGPIKS